MYISDLLVISKEIEEVYNENNSAYLKITSPHGTKFSIKQIHDR